MKPLKITILFILFTVLLPICRVCNSTDINAPVFVLEMHHRFSEPVKNRYSATGTHSPARGSIDYYTQLVEHDRALRSRRIYAQLAEHDSALRSRQILELDKTLTFFDGNSTFRISSLGYLHYTTVSLGSPGMKFLVALDTGSDLFWVPCDCTQCAPTEGTPYSSDFELSIYIPKLSSTSKDVTCNNSLCAQGNRCKEPINHCPYKVSYVSSETSTTGFLFEDILKLKSEESDQELVKANVIFGCGQVQTGSFLDVAAPNGLFGLGLEKISVPSILSTQGYIADSFSMCFGNDGSGRVSLGDKGSPNQEETPFNVNPQRPTYNITLTQMRVGTTIIVLEITALFDSGTSFTYLVDPAYTKFTDSFHSQVSDRRTLPDPRIPFEYCYDMSPDGNSSLIPAASLTMKGDGQFAINDPLIVISSQRGLLYCLAIVKSAELNIIGQNFMTGYRVVFDREKLALGWEKSNCYDIEDSTTILAKSHNSSMAPPDIFAGLGDRPCSVAAQSLQALFRILQSLALQLSWYIFG